MKTKTVQKITNPVYFGLEYYEAIKSKKELLSSEMSLLNILKIARKYYSLRKEENDMKAKIYRAVKELDASLRKTKTFFPFLKIPERARRESLKKETSTGTIRKNVDEDLETELRKIQERLRTLSA